MSETQVQRLCTKTAASVDPNPARACREVADTIHASEADLNFLFLSSCYDLGAVAAEWRRIGAGPTMCCTTAGEISQRSGHSEKGIVGASMQGVMARIHTINSLTEFGDADGERLHDAAREFAADCEPGEHLAAVILLDGMSKLEEKVVAKVNRALGGIPLVGGSAGDSLRFEKTHILADGAFKSNVATIALIATPARIATFQEHHFEPWGEPLVVTAANPGERRVLELDGLPAGVAYRRAIGWTGGAMTFEAMAVAPFVLEIGGRTYLRSIAGECDGALSLYCAIEEGVVLRIGRPTDMKTRLSRMLQALGSPRLVLGFDCILRRLEMQHFGTTDQVAQVLRQLPFVGFSTYGEVFGGLHVNQTLTGIAFGD